MAKYCLKCGRRLSDGQDTCPYCHIEGRESGAAPFTSITAETEAWQSGRGRHEKVRSRLQRQTVGYSLGAALVATAAAAVILFIQPVNRVIRALNAGDYAEAREIYLSDSKLSAGEYGDELDRAVVRAARQVYDDFAAHRLDEAQAEQALAILKTIGSRSGAVLDSTYSDLRTVTGSQTHMELGNALAEDGAYLAAREEYLQVLPADPDYDLALENAAACLERYAETVIAGANPLILTGDYVGAIEALEAGQQVLLDYNVYNEALGFKLTATYGLYDQELLRQAADMAAVENYSGAAELLEAGMARFQRRPEALTAAVAQYRSQAGGKTFADAVAEARRLSSLGDWNGAFARLEAARENPEIDPAELRTAIAELETDFCANRLEAARAALNGSRENVSQAVELISAALRIRDLQPLRDYQSELSLYLPASLADIIYTDKNGTIFRNSGVFEGLDGQNFSDGWIWGENGADVTFQLDGVYDQLDGTFSTRRSDTVQATGYFEVYCDGTLVFVSEAIRHPEAVSFPISVRISGCRSLRIRFVNDYSVRSADDGYCYHGFCSPTLTRDLPQ